MLSEDFEKINMWLKKTSAPYEVVTAVSRIKKDIEEGQNTPTNNASLSLLREARTELTLAKLAKGLRIRILNHMQRTGVA